MPIGKVNIEKWNPSVDGKLDVENMKKKLTNQGYHSTVYHFPPGTDFPDHTHSYTKKDAIVAGEFRMEMLGEVVVLQPGDIIVVPAQVVHNASVIGNKTVVFVDGSK